MIEAFKQTLGYYGVTGKQLSEITGIAQATISEIRRGKSDPSVSTFWRLIAACEQVAPGSLEHFCRLLVGGERLGERLEDLIELASDEETERVMLVIARKWRLKSANNKQAVRI